MRARALIITSLLLLFCQGSRADESDLLWCTLLGGGGRDMARSIAVDGSGNTYMTGLSESADFPTTTGSFDTSRAGGFDVFVTKIDASGSALVYSTLLGGLAFDEGIAIALDPTGHAYLTGPTKSLDFPITPQAVDTSFNGDFDVFVAKLCPTGDSLDYSTFLGGSAEEGVFAIETDDFGCIYLAGETYSADFPTVSWAFDTSHNGGRDAFAAKIKPSSDTLQYATFLGGSAEEGGYALAVDDLGYAYLSGSTGSSDFPFTSQAFDTTHNGWDDAYVAKLTPMGDDLVYATFLGGRDYDQGYQMALDSNGEIYLTGWTWSSNFPTTPDAYDSSYNDSEDAFLAKLNPMGSDLVYATFLGGQSYDLGLGLALDNTGAAHITGYTKSSDFPCTNGAFDCSYNDLGDIFIAQLDPNGKKLTYATFLGGSHVDYGRSIALDDAGDVYVAGHTWSEDFPVTDGAFQTRANGDAEALIAKLALTVTAVKTDSPPIMQPNTYALHQNFPNPFNASTEIGYQVPEETHVTLRIFNILGQEVKTLLDEDRQRGSHIVTWDGRDHLGQKVASGLYFALLTAGNHRSAAKMALIR